MAFRKRTTERNVLGLRLDSTQAHFKWLYKSRALWITSFESQHSEIIPLNPHHHHYYIPFSLRDQTINLTSPHNWFTVRVASLPIVEREFDVSANVKLLFNYVGVPRSSKRIKSLAWRHTFEYVNHWEDATRQMRTKPPHRKVITICFTTM